MEGILKVLTLAVRIATAWTLLSLLSVTLWVLLLEVGRRFGIKPAPKAPCEERQLSAEMSVLYADFADVDGARTDALTHSDPGETRGTDHICLIGWSSVRRR